MYDCIGGLARKREGDRIMATDIMVKNVLVQSK
jgi:hypothetical protein